MFRSILRYLSPCFVVEDNYANRRFRLFALGVLVIWITLLSEVVHLPGRGVAFVAIEAIMIFFFIRIFASVRERHAVDIIFILALLVYTLEILFIQSLPAWSDTFPDSQVYDSNARAIVMHWQGKIVNAEEFSLSGLMGKGIKLWLPSDEYDYATVLGMSRYAYQVILAVIYLISNGSRVTAIFANTPLLAGAAASVYLLSYYLFDRRIAARYAVLLVILDTNFAVWGSVLLRESFLIFLVILGLLALVKLLKGMGDPWFQLTLFTGSAGLLSLVRFNAVFAMIFAGSIVFAIRIWHLSPRKFIGLAGVLLLGFGVVKLFPVIVPSFEQSLPGKVFSEHMYFFLNSGQPLFSAVQGQLNSGPPVDSVRQEWHDDLRENPLWLNGIKAVSRSIMGPYPWVAFTHGITNTNFYELMYPGMTLWIFCLPAFLFALWRLPIANNPALLMCLIWLGTVSIIYIIGYGQFEPRARMMAMPILWIMAAQGIIIMIEYLNCRCVDTPAQFDSPRHP
ncbi:MAG: phospholipid carrier-dependent glycosyltransferase [Chromatiaceae bacterium]|nr:phospholipid carrier-dependent glycosyltransferase [Chromatiaceae bacterium]